MKNETLHSMDDVITMLDSLLRSPEPFWNQFYSDRDKEVPFFVNVPDENLVSYFDRKMIQKGKVLEFGCGPGRNALYLAKTGCEVDAVDLSEEGKENIIELHNKLYSDFLQPFLHKEIPYFPHVTVGRKNDKEMALRVIKNLPPLRDTMRFTIDKIVVESIGENEESIIEFEVQLPTK